MPKQYTVVRRGVPVKSRRKGFYAGSRGDKIFGRLDCPSGLRKLKPENRVFFLTWKDAVESGYRPCKVCHPLPDVDSLFEQKQDLIRKKKKRSRKARRK